MDIATDSYDKSVNREHGRSSARRIIVMIIAPVVVIGAAIGIFLTVSASRTNEKALQANLETLGRDFYESYYFEQISEAYDADKRSDFLSKYTSLGIKVNLDNLERYPSKDLSNKDMVAEFKNRETGEPCDLTETKVSIFPEEPYDKTDYRIETILSCGFEEK
jgi:hypothetical protein